MPQACNDPRYAPQHWRTFRAMETGLPQGSYTGNIQVKGVRLEFRAFKFSDGNIHVGRITLH